MRPHLLVDISAHGFGHLAQTVPVLQALFRRIPDLKITLRGGLSEALLRARFTLPFQWLPTDSDIGMRMASALAVEVQASYSAYREFHSDWALKVVREAEALQQQAPDLILSNIPYLVLAGAARAQIPAVALSSLNWAAIYYHYCGHFPGAAEVHRQILNAYRTVQLFLRIEPALPMPDLERCRDITPVSAIGHDRRDMLCRHLEINPGDRIVLIALGGVDTALPLQRWPTIPGVRWLVPSNWRSQRNDMKPFNDLPMPFIDILASSDAVLTKPGYGTFVEAACNGIPVLSISRPDWPETPHLTRWLDAHGVLVELDQKQLLAGEMEQPLAQLFSRPCPSPSVPLGAEEAAQSLASLLCT